MLPCYWGITPGESHWQEIEQYFQTFAYSINFSEAADGGISGGATFLTPDGIMVHSGSFLHYRYFTEGDFIVSLEGPTGNLPDFKLSSFLSTYGAPSEIWVAPGREDIFSFQYRLFYPKSGILAVYSSHVVVEENAGVICPNDISDPYLVLWKPGLFEDFFELFFQTSLFNNVDPSMETLFKEIAEVSGIDAMEFYNIYKEENASFCFQIPREKWPDLPPP